MDVVVDVVGLLNIVGCDLAVGGVIRHRGESYSLDLVERVQRRTQFTSQPSTHHHLHHLPSPHQHRPWIHHPQTWNSTHHLMHLHFHLPGNRPQALSQPLEEQPPGSPQLFRLEWPQYVLDRLPFNPISLTSASHYVAARPFTRGNQPPPKLQLDPGRSEPHFKPCNPNPSGSSFSST